MKSVEPRERNYLSESEIADRMEVGEVLIFSLVFTLKSAEASIA